MDEITEIKIEVNRNRMTRWLFLLGCYVGCCACFWQLCHEWDRMSTIAGFFELVDPRESPPSDMNIAKLAAANFKMVKIIIYAIGVHLFATLIYREHTRDTHKQ